MPVAPSTLIGPVVAPAGAMAMIWFDEATQKFARTRLNKTARVQVVQKFLPLKQLRSMIFLSSK